MCELSSAVIDKEVPCAQSWYFLQSPFLKPDPRSITINPWWCVINTGFKYHDESNQWQAAVINMVWTIWIQFIAYRVGPIKCPRQDMNYEQQTNMDKGRYNLLDRGQIFAPHQSDGAPQSRSVRCLSWSVLKTDVAILLHRHYNRNLPLSGLGRQWHSESVLTAHSYK